MKKKMPFRGFWVKELSGDLGKDGAEKLLFEAEERYFALCAGHTGTEDRVLKKHLLGNIFPQMALYLSLSKTAACRADALGKMRDLHFLTLEKQKRQYEFLGRFPFAFVLARVTIPLIIRFSFPPSGWENEWIENSGKSITLKVHRCFYKNILKEYGVPELISVYCDGDDYVFGGRSSPYIGWGRTITMSRGGSYCDVVYYNKAGQNEDPDGMDVKKERVPAPGEPGKQVG